MPAGRPFTTHLSTPPPPLPPPPSPSPPPPLAPASAGSATALTPKFAHLPKEYSGTIRLGESTTTYDAAGTASTRACQPRVRPPWAMVGPAQRWVGRPPLGELSAPPPPAGKVEEELPWGHVTDEQLQQAAASFVGEILQASGRRLCPPPCTARRPTAMPMPPPTTQVVPP